MMTCSLSLSEASFPEPPPGAVRLLLSVTQPEIRFPSWWLRYKRWRGVVGCPDRSTRATAPKPPPLFCLLYQSSLNVFFESRSMGPPFGSLNCPSIESGPQTPRTRDDRAARRPRISLLPELR